MCLYESGFSPQETYKRQRRRREDVLIPAGLESVWVKNGFLCYGACDPSYEAANHTYLLLENTHTNTWIRLDWISFPQNINKTFTNLFHVALPFGRSSFCEEVFILIPIFRLTFVSSFDSLCTKIVCVCMYVYKRWRETGEVGITYSAALTRTVLWPAAFSDSMNKISACSATSLSKRADQEINLPHTSPLTHTHTHTTLSCQKRVGQRAVFSVRSTENTFLILNPSGSVCM